MYVIGGNSNSQGTTNYELIHSYWLIPQYVVFFNLFDSQNKNKIYFICFLVKIYFICFYIGKLCLN